MCETRTWKAALQRCASHEDSRPGRTGWTVPPGRRGNQAYWAASRCRRPPDGRSGLAPWCNRHEGRAGSCQPEFGAEHHGGASGPPLHVIGFSGPVGAIRSHRIRRAVDTLGSPWGPRPAAPHAADRTGSRAEIAGAMRLGSERTGPGPFDVFGKDFALGWQETLGGLEWQWAGRPGARDLRGTLVSR